MTVEEIKNYFNNRTVYIFNGPMSDLQNIVGASFTVLVVNGKIYFSVTERDDYTPSDERMELI